jgi:hypothetical protein
MSYPLKSLPYVQHTSSFSSCTQPSFGTINNPCVGQKLTNNINAYLNSVIDSKLLKEAKYWQSTNIGFNNDSFTLVTTGEDFNYMYLTTGALLAGHIKVSDLTTVGIFIPPSATNLLAAIAVNLGRPARIGDTFSISISNSNTGASLFLMTNIPDGFFSPGNSTYNGWLDRFILVGTTSTYWIRVEGILPGVEAYSFFKTSSIYNDFTVLPNPAMFPDSATAGFAVSNLYSGAGAIPAPSGTYDTTASDPSTNVPS